MDISKRVSALARLGQWLKGSLDNGTLEPYLTRAYQENAWFTIDNTSKAIKAVVRQFLDGDKIKNWLAAYHLPLEPKSIKTIGIVMAGNIPLVGWQDLQSVLVSGHKAMVKLSSKDAVLPKMLVRGLVDIEPRFGEYIVFTERLEGFDAVIATGSNNTNRYFEYYFGKYPHILRKNRNSLAVLTGKETQDELARLGEDIFAYFGLGCRNVSMLWVPKGYDFSGFFKAIEPEQAIVIHKKYGNNYDYNKSLLLLNKEAHLDNGFLLVKESSALATPVSVLHYQTYQYVDEAISFVAEQADNIQCVVARPGLFTDSLGFGDTQKPGLENYADDVDVMEWLMALG